jgi:hypothetical protein
MAGILHVKGTAIFANKIEEYYFYMEKYCNISSLPHFFFSAND